MKRRPIRKEKHTTQQETTTSTTNKKQKDLEAMGELGGRRGEGRQRRRMHVATSATNIH